VLGAYPKASSSEDFIVPIASAYSKVSLLPFLITLLTLSQLEAKDPKPLLTLALFKAICLESIEPFSKAVLLSAKISAYVLKVFSSISRAAASFKIA